MGITLKGRYFAHFKYFAHTNMNILMVEYAPNGFKELSYEIDSFIN